MLTPKTPTDLTLAPVAAGIDLNLQRLRDASPKEIVQEVALSLNANPAPTRDGRAKQILEVATRDVDLHGWAASVSDDSTRLELRGGSVSLDVALSLALRAFIEETPA